MRRIGVLVGLFLLLGVAPGRGQSPDATPSSLAPGPWEFTAALSVPGYLDDGAAGDVFTTSRGVGGRVGLRPTSARRTLVEAYGLYAPARHGAYDQAPRLLTLGVQTSYLARPADRRLNPYVAAGMGFWHRAAPSSSASSAPCPPAGRCPSSSVEGGTTLSLVLGGGAYLTVTSTVALRAAVSAHAPLALGGDQGTPHPVVSLGISIRP